MVRVGCLGLPSTRLCPRNKINNNIRSNKRSKGWLVSLKYLSAILSFLTRWAVWPHLVILCAGIKGQNVCWPLALLEVEWKGPPPQQNTKASVRDLEYRLYKACDLARRIHEILQYSPDEMKWPFCAQDGIVGDNSRWSSPHVDAYHWKAAS